MHWIRLRPPRIVLRLIVTGIVIAATVAVSSWLRAASPLLPSGNRAAREEAIRAIPFDQLTDQMRARLSAVVMRPTLYRRLPVEVVYCDPQMYLFLVRYPEVMVNIWQVMGITKCTTRRTGPFSLVASDGAGTQTRIELVYGTDDTHVLYAEGTYEGPLLKKKVNGRAVLVLRSGYAADPNGRTLVSSRLDVFLQLDDAGAELLAKTLHPLVGKAADYNFVQSAQFLGKISDAAEINAPGVQRLAQRLTHVDPAVRQRFAELADAVGQRAALRHSALNASATGLVDNVFSARSAGTRPPR